MFLRLMFALLLTGVACACSPGKAASSQEVRIAPQQMVIHTPQRPNASVAIAACELQLHLQLITGVTVPIRTTPAEAGDTFVFHVGIVPENDNDELQTEEARYRIRATEAWLYGKDELPTRRKRTDMELVLDWQYARVGTLFSVYNFLDNELQVRWPMPGDENIVCPEYNQLRLTLTDNTWVPALKVRSLWATSYEDWYYRRIREDKGIPDAFKLSTGEQAKQRIREELWRRRMRMGQSIVLSHRHSFTRWWNKYGESQPEFFALNPNGERKPWRAGGAPSRVCMCVSNTKLHKEIVRQWLIQRKRFPGRNETINVCENDSAGYCECGECKKLDALKHGEESGDHVTDRYIFFANSILKEARKTVPDVKACMFAYQEYRHPPRKTRVDKDIILSFVPKLWDSEEELDAQYKGWRKMGAEKFLLRTNGLHIDTGLPMGFEEKIFRNFKIGLSNQIIGTRYDAIQSFWPTSGIANYILARGFYSPEQDFAHWEKEYCDMYGAASQHVMAYYRYWRNNIWNGRIYPDRQKLVREGYGFLRTALYWSRGSYYRKSDFDATDAILEKASACSLRTQERSRLNVLLLANKHARMVYYAMRAGAQYDPAGSNAGICRAGFEAVRNLLSFRLENRDRIPFCWGRLIRYEMDSGDAASCRLVSLSESCIPIRQLPVLWHGSRDNGLSPSAAARKFHTWQTLAVNQYWQRSLGEYRGTVWYGTELPNRSTLPNRRISLLFGGVRGSASIYVNGALVSQGRKNWREPFLVDIDKHLNARGNTLVIKISDGDVASGIWRPVWIVANKD